MSVAQAIGELRAGKTSTHHRAPDPAVTERYLSKAEGCNIVFKARESNGQKAFCHVTTFFGGVAGSDAFAFCSRDSKCQLSVGFGEKDVTKSPLPGLPESNAEIAANKSKEERNKNNNAAVWGAVIIFISFFLSLGLIEQIRCHVA